MGEVRVFPETKKVIRQSQECFDAEALSAYLLWMGRATRGVVDEMRTERKVTLIKIFEGLSWYELRWIALKSPPTLWRSSTRNMQYYGMLVFYLTHSSFTQ